MRGVCWGGGLNPTHTEQQRVIPPTWTEGAGEGGGAGGFDGLTSPQWGGGGGYGSVPC